VDGKYQGVTPLALRLAKRSPHTIRIEKEGYRPIEIRVKRSKLWFAVVFPNLIWTALLLPVAAASGIDAQGEAQENFSKALLIIALSASPGAMLADGLSQKSYKIEPAHLSVTLERDSGGGEPVIIHMDAADFQNIMWISVLDDDAAAHR
jgi:hypothetical protein